MPELIGKSLTGWRFVGGVVVGAVAASTGAFLIRTPADPLVKLVPLECPTPAPMRVRRLNLLHVPAPDPSSLLWPPPPDHAAIERRLAEPYYHDESRGLRRSPGRRDRMFDDR